MPLKLSLQEQLQEVHTRTTLGRGTVSPSTLEASDLATKSSSTPLHEVNETISSEHLQWLSGKGAFCQQLMTNWLREQSEIPSQIFLQPLGKMGGKRTKRMTPQHSWHLTMSPSAQYEQQPPSYIESNPTQEPTKTPQFPQSGGTIESNTSPQHRSEMRYGMQPINWGGHLPHLGRRDWDTLHLLRGSNGDVPWWMPSLPNHDDRSLVQRCLPAIHSQASRRVQPRSLTKNANPYVPQEHSRLFVTHSFTSRLKATQPSR